MTGGFWLCHEMLGLIPLHSKFHDLSGTYPVGLISTKRAWYWKYFAQLALMACLPNIHFVATETGFQEVFWSLYKLHLSLKHTHADSRIEFEPSEWSLQWSNLSWLLAPISRTFRKSWMLRSSIFGPRVCGRHRAIIALLDHCVMI